MSLVGAYHVSKFMLGYVQDFRKFYLRSYPDLYANYGSPNEASWAVVTGGSDGIGLEICH